MVRPYWYPRGRILETGVPEVYLNERRGAGSKVSKQDIIRFGKKNAQRNEMREWINKYLKHGELSPIQKRLGVRKIC